MRIYIGLGQSPMSGLRDDRVREGPCLNALKFLQWGCKNGGRDGRTYARQRAARREAPGDLLQW